jgi:hypothetical protein
MSVLNPFFRQQVQNPGMDVSVAQRPVADTTQFQDELMNEQTEAFNAMMELGVVYAKAQSQIKEDERSLALKKASNDILGDANTILQGYAQNKQFEIKGHSVDPGEKGFHTYDGFDQDKSAIESAIVHNLKEKYNPEGDQRLSELIEIQTKSALAQTFADAEKSIVRNINDEVLTQLTIDGKQALDNLVATGDFSKITEIDALIDAKQNNGSISYSKALEFKTTWRKEAWTSMALQLTRTGSTNQEKERYLEVFGKAINSKLPGNKEKMSPETQQFFQHFSLPDLLNINQSIGAGAYSPEKAIQQATLVQMFAEDPLKSTKLFNTKFNWTYETEGPNKGKPKNFTMSGVVDYNYEYITVKSGKLADIGSRSDLMQYASDEKERDFIRRHFDDPEKTPWDSTIKVRVRKEKTIKEISELHVKQIEKKLNELQLNFIDPKSVLDKLKEYGNKRLKEDKDKWTAGSFDKNSSLMFASLEQMKEQWNHVFGIVGLDDQATVAKYEQVPKVPWLDPTDSSYKAWQNNDPRTLQLRQQAEQFHNVMLDVQSLHNDLIGLKYVVPRQMAEAKERFEGLNKSLAEIPYLDNPNDEKGLRSQLRFLKNKAIQQQYKRIMTAVFNNTGSGESSADLVKKKMMAENPGATEAQLGKLVAQYIQNNK